MKLRLNARQRRINGKRIRPTCQAIYQAIIAIPGWKTNPNQAHKKLWIELQNPKTQMKAIITKDYCVMSSFYKNRIMSTRKITSPTTITETMVKLAEARVTNRFTQFGIQMNLNS